MEDGYELVQNIIQVSLDTTASTESETDRIASKFDTWVIAFTEHSPLHRSLQ